MRWCDDDRVFTDKVRGEAERINDVLINVRHCPTVEWIAEHNLSDTMSEAHKAITKQVHRASWGYSCEGAVHLPQLSQEQRSKLSFGQRRCAPTVLPGYTPTIRFECRGTARQPGRPDLQNSSSHPYRHLQGSLRYWHCWFRSASSKYSDAISRAHGIAELTYMERPAQPSCRRR